jgi:acetyl-CoA acetyltransferase
MSGDDVLKPWRSAGAAIAGIGTVGFGKFGDESVASLSNRARVASLDYCGLQLPDIDGLLIHIGSPRVLDYDEMARLLALDLQFAGQTWSHGRFCGTIIQHAALALAHGLADCIACVGSFRNSPFSRHGSDGFPGFAENFREGGGPHAETPHAGLLGPIGGAALSTQRYLHRYGIDREKLAAVAIAQRNAAASNPLAAQKKPITREDYVRSPFIAEPLRLLDCSYPVDTATAVIMTRVDRARDLKKKPIKVLGMQGLCAGPNEFVFGQPGLGINQRDSADYEPSGGDEPVYSRAGVSPEDVDTFHCYDGFSPQVLWTLERFGFAKPGEAADWAQDGRIELSGAFPVNTSGGHLSEGHSNGWGQTVEIVRQLRGEAGARQVDCEIAMWGTTFGDAVLYGHD